MNIVNPNIANSNLSYITPSANSLVLFPSYLSHRIAEHQSKKIRRSLAFNIVPVGGYGEYDSSYNTKWFTT